MAVESPLATCPACGATEVKGGVCARCGYAVGEANRCPHCGIVARAVEREKPGARWVCANCGGPRMPNGLGAAASMAALRETQALERRAARSRAFAWVWGVSAAFCGLVLAAGANGNLSALLLLLVAVVAPALFAVRALLRASRERAEAHDARERAWLAAIEDVVAHAPKGMSASELATRIAIAPAEADRLLTALAVHDRARVEVGDESEVRYTVEPAERVRIDAEAALAAEHELEGDEASELATRETRETRSARTR